MRVEAGHLCQSVKHDCSETESLFTHGRRHSKRKKKRERENEADGSDMVSSEKDIWSTTAHVEKKPEARGKGAEQGCFEHL